MYFLMSPVFNKVVTVNTHVPFSQFTTVFSNNLKLPFDASISVIPRPAVKTFLALDEFSNVAVIVALVKSNGTPLTRMVIVIPKYVVPCMYVNVFILYGAIHQFTVELSNVLTVEPSIVLVITNEVPSIISAFLAEIKPGVPIVVSYET